MALDSGARVLETSYRIIGCMIIDLVDWPDFKSLDSAVSCYNDESQQGEALGRTREIFVGDVLCRDITRTHVRKRPASFLRVGPRAGLSPRPTLTLH